MSETPPKCQIPDTHTIMTLATPRLWDGLHTPIQKGLDISFTRERLECLDPIFFHLDLTQQDFTVWQRIYTDANLYDPEELTVIAESANQILTDLKNKAVDDNVMLPTDVELVLEIIPQGPEKICGYYFVNHNSRCLFWLEEFDAEQICNDIKVVVSLSHLRKSGFELNSVMYNCEFFCVGYEIESQYWWV